VLRSFVYAAPLLAPLAALALAGLVRRRGRLPAVGLVATLAVAALVLTATRGLNVAFERVTADDVVAARTVFEQASPGQAVGILQPTGALGIDRVGEFQQVVLREDICGKPVLQCADDMRPEFIVISRTQDAWGQLQDGLPEGWTTDVADHLVDRGMYEVVYRGDDSEVLRAVDESKG
jgi:hypothetical protein